MKVGLFFGLGSFLLFLAAPAGATLQCYSYCQWVPCPEAATTYCYSDTELITCQDAQICYPVEQGWAAGAALSNGASCQQEHTLFQRIESQGKGEAPSSPIAGSSARPTR